MALALLFLGGCLSPSRNHDAPPLARGSDQLALRFPGAQALLPGISAVGISPIGISALGGSPGWRTGDRALLGLEIANGNELDRWLIELECVEQPTDGVSVHTQSSMTLTTDDGQSLEIQSTEIQFEVRLRDAQGTQLETSRPVVPASFLSEGLFDACELAESRSGSEEEWERMGATLGEEDLVKFARGVACCISLTQVLQDDSALGPIFMDVVRRPPLYTFLTYGGIELGIAPALDRTRRATFGVLGKDEAGYILPLVITANDHVALECDLFVLRPDPPIHVVGGVVAIEASGSSRDQGRFRWTLLGAERGAEEDALSITH